jgi:hypothetical protein
MALSTLVNTHEHKEIDRGKDSVFVDRARGVMKESVVRRSRDLKRISRCYALHFHPSLIIVLRGPITVHLGRGGCVVRSVAPVLTRLPINDIVTDTAVEVGCEPLPRAAEIHDLLLIRCVLGPELAVLGVGVGVSGEVDSGLLPEFGEVFVDGGLGIGGGVELLEASGACLAMIPHVVSRGGQLTV